MSLQASTQVRSGLNLKHTGFGRAPARLGRLPKPPLALIIPPGLRQRQEKTKKESTEGRPPLPVLLGGGAGGGAGAASVPSFGPLQ